MQGTALRAATNVGRAVRHSQRAGGQPHRARPDARLRAERAAGHRRGRTARRRSTSRLKDIPYSIAPVVVDRARHRARGEEPRLRHDVDQLDDAREDSRADDDAGTRRPIGRRDDDERQRPAGRRRALQHSRRELVQRHRSAAVRHRRRPGVDQQRQPERCAGHRIGRAAVRWISTWRTSTSSRC